MSTNDVLEPQSSEATSGSGNPAAIAASKLSGGTGTGTGGAKPGKNSALVRSLIKGAVISFLGLIVVAVVVLAFGVYKLGWNNKATGALSHVLPLPAITVNGDAITLAAYNDDISTVQRYFAKTKELGGEEVPEQPSDADVRQGVKDRLIQMEVLKQEAAKYGIAVSSEDIDAEYDRFQSAGAAEGQEDPAGAILDMYGWTLEQFKDKVIRPYILQQRLAEALAGDAALNGAAETKATELLEQIKGGADFAELATANSADPSSAMDGGNLDWFEKGIMVPEFEEAAFALSVGETSELVKTEFGYHIIRVDEVEKDKAGEVVKVKARHILIAGPTLQSYLEEKTAEATVKTYVKE